MVLWVALPLLTKELALSDMTVTELTAKHYRPRRQGLQPRIYVYPENESIYENFFNRRVRPVSVMKKVALKALRDRGFDIEAADIVATKGRLHLWMFTSLRANEVIR